MKRTENMADSNKENVDHGKVGKAAATLPEYTALKEKNKSIQVTIILNP